MGNDVEGKGAYLLPPTLSEAMKRAGLAPAKEKPGNQGQAGGHGASFHLAPPRCGGRKRRVGPS